MLYVLPLSMSLIFRLLIFSTVVALVFHLYDDLWSDYDSMLGYVFRERLFSPIILSLVLVRHLGRSVEFSLKFNSNVTRYPALQHTTGKTLGTMVGLCTVIDRGRIR